MSAADWRAAGATSSAVESLVTKDARISCAGGSFSSMPW